MSSVSLTGVSGVIRMSRVLTPRYSKLGPGGMNPIELVYKRVAQIRAFAFDIGGTLAEKVDVAPQMVSALARLIRSGKQVSIISAKGIEVISPWIEGETGLISQIDIDKRHLFRVYGDRVTKVYSVDAQGKLAETSKIAFPAGVDKEVVFRVAQAIAERLQQTFLADQSLSPAVRAIIAANPIKAKAGDEYIQVISKESIDVKGDKTASKARKMIKAEIERALAEVNIPMDDLTVTLDGKKGAYIKNKLAEKPGAVLHLQQALGSSVEEIVYIGDQFAGGNTADLSVAETGVLCVNVGEDKEYGTHNVYNAETGPEGTLGFIETVLLRTKL